MRTNEVNVIYRAARKFQKKDNVVAKLVSRSQDHPRPFMGGNSD